MTIDNYLCHVNPIWLNPLTFSLWVGIRFTGEWCSHDTQLRIQISIEEDKLSPFDSKSPPRASTQSKPNNKHVYVYICNIHGRMWLVVKPMQSNIYIRGPTNVHVRIMNYSPHAITVYTIYPNGGDNDCDYGYLWYNCSIILINRKFTTLMRINNMVIILKCNG